MRPRSRFRFASRNVAVLGCLFALFVIGLYWIEKVPEQLAEPAKRLETTPAQHSPRHTPQSQREQWEEMESAGQAMEVDLKNAVREHQSHRRPHGHSGVRHPPAKGHAAALEKVIAARQGIRCSSMECSDQERRARVVQMMREAWISYKRFAWGADELKPVSKTFNMDPKQQWNPKNEIWGGVSITLVDALDTLWIMGLRDEFYEAVDYVATSLDLERDFMASTFETTIRLLGGLLAAYALSAEPVLLQKAVLVGEKLLPAFGSPSGLPSQFINLKTGERSYEHHDDAHGGRWEEAGYVFLADAGSLQLELRYLSEASGNPAFALAGDKALSQLLRVEQILPGLYPDWIGVGNLKAREPATVGVGAFSDSFYETLLKLWLQSGKQDGKLRTAYDTSVASIVRFLTGTSRSGAAFVSNYHKGKRENEMQHLSCFLPGMLALGVNSSVPVNNEAAVEAAEVLAIAESIAATCYSFYQTQPTGLSGDSILFDTSECHITEQNACDDFQNTNNEFRLRPETVESLFVLSRVTGNSTYKDWAWAIFESIERHCLVEHTVEHNQTMRAYGCYKDVRSVGAGVEDRTESFFYAELLKYFYLHFDDKVATEITKDFVLTTEAHPLPIFRSHP